MGSIEILSADVITALDEGAVLLTGTSRLARELRAEYNSVKQQIGVSSWASPTIQAIGTWLTTLWRDELCFREIGNDAVLLSRTQEEAIWEHVIQEWCGRENKHIIQKSAAADSARSAFALVHEWHLPMPTLDIHPNDDVRAFIAWKQAFDEWCTRNGRLSLSEVPQKVTDAFRAGVLSLPPALFLAGFEEETPSQRELLAALKEAGVGAQKLDPPNYNLNVRVATCQTPADEIATCAQWIRHHLMANPEHTVGVVVPDLSQRRAHIARVFEDVLSPASVLPAATPQQHVNFSLGPPLADYPLVSSALHALDLLCGEIELNPLGSLLRSPFFAGGETESQKRALLDVHLRRLGERTVRLKWLIQQTESRTPILESKLKAFQGFADDLPRTQSPARWAQTFEDALSQLSWPGERSLNSFEHQVRVKWKDLLDTFAGLESVAAPMSLREALSRLRRLAAKIPFQPASDNAPVQVMGFLEAAGAHFDALWVMGLTDVQLPGLPHAHPLLPLALQREHNTPHSSPTRELAFAQDRLDGLVHAAPEVVLSFGLTEDETENVPSPLLWPFLESPFSLDAEPKPAFAQSLIGAVKLDELEESTAPALTEKDRASGGADVLKSQAACPFQAFGKHRLHARQMEEADEGLNARDLGSLIHDALDKLWDEMGDLETLKALSASQLLDLKTRVVDDAIDAAKQKLPTTFKPAFTALQCTMLHELLDGWIEQEMRRSPFKVLNTELELTDQQIGDLTINRLVVDRIDELEDGSHVIIDYKTGRGKSRGAWKGKRPEEPQLPLYTSLADGPIAGVMFANVKTDDPKWSGVTRDDGVIDRQKAYPSGSGKSEWENLYPDWDSLLSTWRHDLESLANAYVAGTAHVDPKNPKSTCKYCHLNAACRIRELTERSGSWLLDFEEEEDDD